MSALARLLEAAPLSDVRETRARLHREINRERRAANRLLEAVCVELGDELLRRGVSAPDCPYCRASVVPGAPAHRPRPPIVDRMPDAEAMALGAALVEAVNEREPDVLFAGTVGGLLDKEFLDELL